MYHFSVHVDDIDIENNSNMSFVPHDVMSCDPTYLLLNVLCHTSGVFGETFRIDHAIEGIRCDSECQSDILTVAQHANIHYNVIF